MLFVYFTHIFSYLIVCFNSCSLSQGLVKLALSEKLVFIAYLSLLSFMLLFSVLSYLDFGIANTLRQVISYIKLAKILCRIFLCKSINVLNIVVCFAAFPARNSLFFAGSSQIKGKCYQISAIKHTRKPSLGWVTTPNLSLIFLALQQAKRGSPSGLHSCI